MQSRLKCKYVFIILMCTLFLINWVKRTAYTESSDPTFADEVLKINCAAHDSSFELYHYDQSDMVQCFDQLSSHLQLENRPLHFAFIGDSRIRQAFHTFWPLIPKYDLRWNSETSDRRTLRFHADMEVGSDILNTEASFRWRPKIDTELLSELDRWSSGTEQVPPIIVTGFAGHHMEQRDARSRAEFEQQIVKLASAFKLLANRTRIIYVHQNPIINTYGNKNNGGAILRSATNEKYDGYNKFARQALKDTGIHYFESAYPVAEEYVRGCYLNDRTDKGFQWACFDFIHTGYIVLNQAMQFIFNALCNRLPTKSRSSL